MIKSILSAIICILFCFTSSISISAQCDPDPQYEIYPLGVFPFPYNENPDNPNFPDSAYVGVTDTVYAGEPWSMTFTARIPEEVDFNGTQDLEYVRVGQVTGLPNGFSYECSADACTYAPGTHCFLVSGTTWDVGVHDITVEIFAKMENFYTEIQLQIPPLPGSDPSENPLNFPEGFYTATVISLTNISESDILSGFISAYPNPFKDQVSLNFNSLKDSNVSLSISNLSGKTVHTESFYSSAGHNEHKLQTSSWENGIYFYEITDGFSAVQGKIIKQ